MRSSNLLWIVALLIVLGADRTRQQPRMLSRRRIAPQPQIFEDDAEVDEYDDLDAKLNAQLKRLDQYSINDDWDASADEELQSNTPCDGIPESQEELRCTTICPPMPLPVGGCDQLRTAGVQQQQQQQFPQQQQQQQPYPQQEQQPQQQYQPTDMDDSEQRGKELRRLVQHLYVAQARVQLEATEIHKAQAVATSAQVQLEDSANHVRTITASLHNAQQEVAAAAIRAQIAQLQLAAHDQLLFAARQDVDALSSQVVGLQAAEGIVQPKLTVDLHALLDKLRQPLQQFDRPTPVPMIITVPPLIEELPVPAPYNDGYDLDSSDIDFEEDIEDDNPFSRNSHKDTVKRQLNSNFYYL